MGDEGSAGCCRKWSDEESVHCEQCVGDVETVPLLARLEKICGLPCKQGGGAARGALVPGLWPALGIVGGLPCKAGMRALCVPGVQRGMGETGEELGVVAVFIGKFRRKMW